MNQFEKMKSHQCRAVDVKETVKLAEITDPFGNLRYKVSLTSYDIIDDGKYSLCYQIQVINYFGIPEPIIIVDRPEYDERPIHDYKYAISIYNEYVKSYSNLVKAENRDHQDIDVYKENIGYKKTLPECCSTCKWCRRRKLPYEYIYGVSDKLECTNPLNCKQFEHDIVREHDPYRERIESEFGHRLQPEDYSHNIIYPDVDPFGKCDHYIVATRPQNIAPGMNVTDFIDMRLGTRLDNRFKDVAYNTISSGITGELSVPINEAVKNSLSQPETSSMLSVPVVNLVTYSPQIKAETVNVIGDALSTNVLSGPMVNAVCCVIADPAISAAFEAPVAAAMETPSVKAATTNVIGNALSTDVLSAQLTPAVATVVPTNEVSTVIVDTAAKGITIDKIIGNNGIANFIDKNNNGIQDADEPDIPTLTTVVLGGEMGA